MARKTVRSRSSLFEGLGFRQLLSTYLVDTTADTSDGDYSAGNLTLREAIELSNANAGADEIRFDASLDGQDLNITDDLVPITGAVAIRGVDAGGQAVNLRIVGNTYRVFQINDGDGATDIAVTLESLWVYNGSSGTGGGAVYSTEATTITGCTFQQNTGYVGGAVYANGGSLTIADSQFTENHASYAGAIRVSSAPFTITGSTFSANTTDNYGGAMYLYGYNDPVTYSIADSTFDGNSATRDAGAIYIDAGETTTVTVSGVGFTGNSANSGGGIYSYDAAPLTVVDSNFVGNLGTHAGGAIYSDGPLSVSGSTFQTNRTGEEGVSTGAGGAIYSSNDTTAATITGSLFEENDAFGYAGAIYRSGTGGLVVTDTIIRNNTATYSGGGISLYSGMLTVSGSTFSGNSGDHGGAIHTDSNTTGIEITDSDFLENTAQGGGGAVYAYASITVRASTFRGNTAGNYGGGGIYIRTDEQGSLIEDSTFEQNTCTEYGGAVFYSYAGTLTITGSTLSGNAAPEGGGGVFSENGSLTVLNSVISGNDTTANTGYGGGILFDDGTLTIRNSTISGNSGGYGGGILAGPQTTSVVIFDSAIDDNTSLKGGGGLYVEPGPSVDIIGCSFSRNQAVLDGGAIHLYMPGSTTILNTTISGNSSEHAGGGIVVRVGGNLVSIANTTIANNHANATDSDDSSHGGGIVLHNDTGAEYARIESTIVAGNLFGAAGQPDEIFIQASFGFDADSGGFNLVQDAGTAGGISDGERGNLVGVDPLLGALRDNGSGRMTHALLTGSPAIDAGSNPYGKGTDQRGTVFSRASGQPDIGAYERQTLALVVDSAADGSDGDHSAGNLTLREATELSNANPLTDSITFDESLRGSTIVLTGGQMTLSDAVTITGLGIASLTIDAADASRHFLVDDGDSGTRLAVSITDARLTHGNAADGGSISNAESLSLSDVRLNLNNATGDGGAIRNTGELTLYRVIIADNSAGDSGGAIDNDGTDSPTTITNGHILRNSAGGEGGAIDHDGGPLTIDASEFIGNTSGNRGGVIANLGALTVEDTYFSDNTASNGGGAIFNGDAGTATVTSSSFRSNTAGFGGAIHNTGSLDLIRSDIYGNAAGGNGGGVSNGVGGRLNIEYSSIANNTAGGDGGGVFSAWAGRLLFCTVSTNSADGSGGGVELADVNEGVYFSTIAFNTADADNNGSGEGGGLRIGKNSLNGEMELQFTILAENTTGAGTASDLVTTGGAVLANSFANLVGDADTAAGLVDGVDSNRVGREARLGPLEFHGGETRVHALLSGNAAIDIGLTSAIFFTDQQGRPRGYGASDDAGAWEYAPTEYSLDSIDTATVRGDATADGTHRFLIRNADGDLVVFGQSGSGWLGYNLQELTAAPDAIDGGVLWTDPTDGLTYVAAPSAEGLIVFQLDAQGFWSYRNLSGDLRVADGDFPIGSLVQMVTRTDEVILAGLTLTGRISVFKQTGEFSGSDALWEYVDVSGDLEAQAMSTPEFSGLTAYVTRWNAWNIVGIDADGDIQSVWINPATFSQWRTDNLSDITGAPPLSGQLSVTLTSWSAINLGGVNEQGHLVVTWWVPAFKGNWVTSDLTNAAGGQTFTPGVVTGFVTPWGAINYAGLTANGQVAAYWWTPQNNRWVVSQLTPDAVSSVPRPVRGLTSFVAPDGAMNIAGIASEDNAIRVWWLPNSGGWQIENLSESAVRT